MSQNPNPAKPETSVNPRVETETPTPPAETPVTPPVETPTPPVETPAPPENPQEEDPSQVKRPLELTSEEQEKLLGQLAQLDQLSQLSQLEQIGRSLETLVELFEETTENLPDNSEETQQETPVVKNKPLTEIAVGAQGDDIVLPDGRTAPAAAVRALTEYDETTWPGALMPEARAAIAHVVLKAVEGNQLPVLRTNYPFCLDDPEVANNDSPCILRSGHRGKHKDNNDGVW